MNSKAGNNPLAGKPGLNAILEAGKPGGFTVEQPANLATEALRDGPPVAVGFKIRPLTQIQIKVALAQIQAETGQTVKLSTFADKALAYYAEHWREIERG